MSSATVTEMPQSSPISWHMWKICHGPNENRNSERKVIQNPCLSITHQVWFKTDMQGLQASRRLTIVWN